MRLALEAAGAPYVDIARGSADAGQGTAALLRTLNDRSVRQPPFAPPFLKDDDFVIGQTAAILQYLAPTLKLVARSEQARSWTMQIQLTIGDMVTEAHDTHHPIASSLHYEDQKAEALRRAGNFCAERIPKFLRWFERILSQNPAGNRFLVGNRLSYADLSLFHLLEGLTFAFPKASRQVLSGTPLVAALQRRVGALPRVATYLRSERRLPFNDEGIFRRYPELDLECQN